MGSLSTELLFNAFSAPINIFALRLETPAESLVALHEKRMASTPHPPTTTTTYTAAMLHADWTDISRHQNPALAVVSLFAE